MKLGGAEPLALHCRDIPCTKSHLRSDRRNRRARSRFMGIVCPSRDHIGDSMPKLGHPSSAFRSYNTLIPNFGHLEVASIRRMGTIR